MDFSADHHSVWFDTTSSTHYPSISEAKVVTADVIVVGGGLAGITTAFLLQRSGKKVVVLEARKIGEGVSGHTTAHITMAHELIYDHLIKTFGKGGAATYAQASQTAIETIATLVRELQIDCDFHRVDEYVFAEHTEEEEGVVREFEALQTIHAAVQIEKLSTSPLPFKTLTTIKYHNQAQFHPRKYLLALAAEFVKMGGMICEHSRVTNVHEDEPCVVEVSEQKIVAKKVVIATHFPILDRGGFFARMVPERSYVMAATIKDNLPLAMFDSAEDPSHYIRMQQTPQGNVLIVGGEDHVTGQARDTREHFEKLRQYIQQRFDVTSFLYHWSSQDNYTYDRVPFIGSYLPTSKHLFVITGLNGWGMTNSTVGALLLHDLVLEKENNWSSLYTPLRFKVTQELLPIMNMGWETVKHKVKKKLGQIHLPQIENLDDLELKPGSSRVVLYRGEDTAVYKDRQGKTHVVSAHCTHLGCDLSFNDAEESWDCPCHGSRFDVDGEVLHSPAITPLLRKT